MNEMTQKANYTKGEKRYMHNMAGQGSAAWAAIPSVSPAAALSCRPKSLSSPLPPGRLASLRNRDLTLGGALKKPKKTFEPNVFAVRKNKEEFKEEELHVAPKKGRKQRDGKRKKERRQTIQSHSIFEQGPAETRRRAVCRGSTDLFHTTANPVCRPVKKELVEEDDDEILNKLQRDDFLDDPALRNEDKLKPIQLPLSQFSCDTQTRSSPNRKGATGFQRKDPPDPPQSSLAELFHNLKVCAGEELFFMQLPDCLPGLAPGLETQPRTLSTAENSTRKKDKPKDRTTLTAPLHARDHVRKDGGAVLSHLPEGFLGKLQIRKSGRIELNIGGITVDVSEGAASSFLQELVSVQLSEGRTGDLMVLGNIKHKLVLSPDFNALLTQATSDQLESST